MKKTMKHIIHIIIISLILLGLAYCFGCKEKAEAEAESITICDNCPHIGWFGEPNSCEARRKADALEESEPNEPLQELTKLFEQVLDHEGRLIDIVGICIERIEKLENNPILNIPVTENPTELITLCKHENTSSCLVYGCNCWTCLDCGWCSEGTKIYFKE